jgi:hypothetical protein
MESTRLAELFFFLAIARLILSRPPPDTTIEHYTSVVRE